MCVEPAGVLSAAAGENRVDNGGIKTENTPRIPEYVICLHLFIFSSLEQVEGYV